MTISAKDAAAAAKRWGLTLSDAAALARLADSPAEADELASAFTEPSVPQLSRAALATMKPAEIEAARASGALKNLLEGGAEGGEAK
jgi:hypothetical protein